jgi:IclR family transcriptional regulator, KDG regulon repressor
MKSLRKGMEIIKMLTDGRGRVTVADICEAQSLPRSTVYRILAAACDEGILQQDIEPAVYTAGPELRRLTNVLLAKLDIRQVALPIMTSLARATTHSIYLMTRSKFEAVCIEMVEGSDGLRLSVGLGTSRLLHCSGIAKVFLPCLGEEEIEQYLRQKLPSFTDATITSAKAIRREIEATRRQGYGISSGEFALGARSLGFPIRDFRGDVVAGLGIGGSMSKLSDRELPKIVTAMQEGAEAISIGIGFTPPAKERLNASTKVGVK